MRRVVVLCLFALGATLPVQAELVEGIARLGDLIELRCGPRIDVVWVDESGAAPPCLHTYSPGCDEVQRNAANLCVAPPQESTEEATLRF
ncbi:hypothetical protein GCM10007860_26120 [Chitiniphilus shinanonensis]|uniref:Secreted protein n=1 Tax=Chitiniphilus shinanonensis TaxID=553088 RepID=A0ABQ6BUW2_9NEIS|nr:hypothetical protein [Chitiniphilus shinanonensis]GLS05459.1 hypothetical protein GCM10007860_26120 [Chitiniphilus shinanonensis]